MTNALKLSLISLSAGALLAGAAQAQDVHVSILGKSPKAVHAELVQAALRVCAGESSQIAYAGETDHAACMRATMAKADLQYRNMKVQLVAMAKGD